MFIPISSIALGLAESGSELLFNLLESSSVIVITLNLGLGIAFLLRYRLNTIIVDSIGIIDLRTIRIQKNLNIF